MAKQPQQPVKRGRGRPLTYTPEIAQRIAQRIAEGESLRSAAAHENVPESTVRQWAIDDVDGFKGVYDRAYAIQVESEYDRMREIEEQTLRGELDPKAANAVLSNQRWRLGKRHAKAFGDRQTHEVTGKDGGPVEVQTTRIILERRT